MTAHVMHVTGVVLVPFDAADPDSMVASLLRPYHHGTRDWTYRATDTKPPAHSWRNSLTSVNLIASDTFPPSLIVTSDGELHEGWIQSPNSQIWAEWDCFGKRILLDNADHYMIYVYLGRVN